MNFQSFFMQKINISVIGEAGALPNSGLYQKAQKLGKALIDNNYRIVNGGMAGIMEATCKGARQSKNFKEGCLVSILPGFDPQVCNPYVDVVIPTGLDNYRNGIVANSDAVIAIGGKAGTLSEMAFAWTFKRMLIAYDVDGWSGKLAGTRIDDRKRVDFEEDKVFKVSNEKEVIETLCLYLKHYKNRHKSIIAIMGNNEGSLNDQ